mmetsp:Transcript_21179/g.50036  ORF Transcript_21179/g.50036 Transcript_21179/m.50036 type:complete len:86 (-) Transcript_21179:244-501(-)
MARFVFATFRFVLFRDVSYRFVSLRGGAVRAQGENTVLQERENGLVDGWIVVFWGVTLCWWNNRRKQKEAGADRSTRSTLYRISK